MRRFTMVALLLLPAAAQAWWNEEWAARKQLRIDTSAAGASISAPIGSTPVLVRLHAGNFKFDQAKEDGSDLRFIASDDKTPLAYHLEKYDSLLGEGLIWVGMPDLKPGAKTELFLYYKNPKAAAAEDAKGTYDKATALVYHFAEKGQPPRDSSAWANHATGAGAISDGALIGRGLRLDGAATVSVPSPAAAKLTWSAWIKAASAEESGVIFSRRDGTKALVVGLDAGKPFVQIETDAGAQRAASTSALAANGWHHLAVTAGDSLALYLDGARTAAAATALPALAGTSLIGGDSNKKPAAGFAGELDELQIATVERPEGFIQFAAISQGTDPGKLIASGQDEENAGWSSGYFAIIIRSVTLDGWVVIGLLAIMAVVSWMVMATKAAYLGAVMKGNDRFAERFAERSADLQALIARPDAIGDAKLLRNSTLHHLFRVGAVETRKRTEGWPLSGEAIQSIRASLDAVLVRENQALNRQMVLLTIAISGGPFLGLLGTVVGVMITFASIAAAGDVNVNAIAPGIAAALVATVAGLAVAIPALFGYNWLLARAKSITATQQVFVDELVTKIAEAYSEREVRPAIVAERAS